MQGGWLKSQQEGRGPTWDESIKDFPRALSQQRYHVDPEVCARLEGQRHRLSLLTRATFLCGFSSFGLWGAAATGAVEVRPGFSLSFLPGPFTPTMGSQALSAETPGPLPPRTEKLQALIWVPAGASSLDMSPSPLIWLHKTTLHRALPSTQRSGVR